MKYISVGFLVWIEGRVYFLKTNKSKQSIFSINKSVSTHEMKIHIIHMTFDDIINCSGNLFSQSFLHIYTFTYLYVQCVCECGGQKTAMRSWSFPSPMWVPGSQSVVRCGGKHLYQLSYLTSPFDFILKVVLQYFNHEKFTLYPEVYRENVLQYMWPL